MAPSICMLVSCSSGQNLIMCLTYIILFEHSICSLVQLNVSSDQSQLIVLLNAIDGYTATMGSNL